MNDKYDFFREKYNNFLKEKIKENCNTYCCYEIYWDYRDEIDANTLLEAYSEYKKQGFEKIEDYLKDKLLDMNLDYDNELTESIKSDMENSSFYTEEFKNWYETNCNLYDDMQVNGYNGIDVNLKGLIDNSRFCFNIMFATDEEQNSDMSNLITAYGTYHCPDFEYLEAKDFDNALTYLIHQQGHTCKEYFETLLSAPGGFRSNHKNDFIESVVDDVVNNTSEAMSELTVLVKMDGQAALEFLDYMENKEDDRNIIFNKNCEIGIFNEWSGCGGLIEIVLDKDFIVPKYLIRSFQIEGAKNNSCSVDEVYGLVGDCWKDCMNYTNEIPKLVEENLEETISYCMYSSKEKEREII